MRGKTSQLFVIALAATLLIGLSGPGNAALLVYEGFDYADGTINGVSSYNGGTGFSSAWVGSTTNVPFSMSDGSGHSHGGAGQPGLAFGSLSTVGDVTLTRKSAPGGAEVHRTLGATEAATLTSGTMYFSALVRLKYYSIGNENLAMTFGTSDVFDPNAKPVTSAGEALGFALKGGTPTSSSIDFQALAVDDGSTSVSAVGGISPGDNVNEVFMIVGEIEWGATDSITLYQNSGGNDGSTGSTNWGDFSEFASLTASVDESQFNTLHVAGQQVSSIDEIRFGQSLEDVGVIPEPSVLTLLGIAALGLIGLRRRK